MLRAHLRLSPSELRSRWSSAPRGPPTPHSHSSQRNARGPRTRVWAEPTARARPPPSPAARRLHGHVDEVLVFQTQLVRGVVGSDPLAVDHKADLRGLQTQAAAVGVHELPQRRGLLDLELDLAALLVLHLELDVCGGSSVALAALRLGGLTSGGHL